jgi:plasmid stabilization system protein ParE
MVTYRRQPPALRPVHLLPAAQAELDAAATWYATEGGATAAQRWLTAFERAGRLLAAFPLIGTPAPRATRLLRIKRFPYALVYRVGADELLVVAVAHDRRAPGYWQGRG